MATNSSQNKWRAKNKLVKRQLNVMAKSHVHDHLQRLADDFRLRGKGEEEPGCATQLTTASQRI